MKLICVRGNSGSGKSVFCSKTFAGTYHLENDMFHVRDGEYRFVGSRQGAAVSWCADACRLALASGMDVVVSNTFTKKKYVETYRKLAAEFGAEFIVYRMRGNFENSHNVPADVLRNMASGFEDWPDEINVYPVDDDSSRLYSATKLRAGDEIELNEIDDGGVIENISVATYGFLNVTYVSRNSGEKRMCYAGDCGQVRSKAV